MSRFRNENAFAAWLGLTPSRDVSGGRVTLWARSCIRSPMLSLRYPYVIGTRVSASTVSDLNQKIYGKIDEWRERPLVGDFPYVFLDGLWLKRSWGGEVKNVSVLVAIGVAQSGYREILAVSEGAKEDKASWTQFLRELKDRGFLRPPVTSGSPCLVPD
jgi:hypothetical protein